MNKSYILSIQSSFGSCYKHFVHGKQSADTQIRFARTIHIDDVGVSHPTPDTSGGVSGVHVAARHTSHGDVCIHRMVVMTDIKCRCMLIASKDPETMGYGHESYVMSFSG